MESGFTTGASFCTRILFPLNMTCSRSCCETSAAASVAVLSIGVCAAGASWVCCWQSFCANLVNSIASSIINLGLSVSVLARVAALSCDSTFLLFYGHFSAFYGLRCTFKCCTRAESRSIFELLVVPLAVLGRFALEGTGSGLINYRKGRIFGKTYE